MRPAVVRVGAESLLNASKSWNTPCSQQGECLVCLGKTLSLSWLSWLELRYRARSSESGRGNFVLSWGRRQIAMHQVNWEWDDELETWTHRFTSSPFRQWIQVQNNHWFLIIITFYLVSHNMKTFNIQTQFLLCTTDTSFCLKELVILLMVCCTSYWEY